MKSLITAISILIAATEALAAGEVFVDPVFDVIDQNDVLYGFGSTGNPASGEIELVLDLYQPTAPPVPRPAMIFIHGGSFETGDKSDFTSLARGFASRGYVAASISYRLLGDDPTNELGFDENYAVNAAVNDATKAVQWLRGNAEKYDVDPTRIAIGGFSAGAITSLLQGFDERGENAEVAAIVSWAGGLYGYEHLIDADDPPLMLIHGESDSVVPFSHATEISNRAQEVSLPFEFIRIPRGGHDTFLRRDVGGNTVEQRSLDFLAEHLSLDELADDYALPTASLVNVGSEWKYFEGGSEPSPPDQPVAWTRRDYEDVDWAMGVDGFGFGRQSESRNVATGLDDMKSNSSSLYLRHRFSVDESLVDTQSLFLDLNYDDGFVAYINGVEVARSNVGVHGNQDGSVPFDARATTRQQVHQARHFIDLSEYPGLLTLGDANLLGIHGLNRRASDSDFYLSQIQLSATVPEPSGIRVLLLSLFMFIHRTTRTSRCRTMR